MVGSVRTLVQCLLTVVGVSESGVRLNSINVPVVINEYLHKESVLCCKNRFILTESLFLRTLAGIDNNALVAMVLFPLPVL